MIPKSGYRFSDKIMRHEKSKSGDLMIRILAIVVALVCAAPAIAQVSDPQNTVQLDTTKGRIVIKLRNDIAPKHAERIKQLSRDGFYTNVPFHRVIAGFMAQTGDHAVERHVVVEAVARK